MYSGTVPTPPKKKVDLHQVWGHFHGKKLNHNQLHFSTDLEHLILFSVCVYSTTFPLTSFCSTFTFQNHFRVTTIHSYLPQLAHNVSFCSVFACVRKSQKELQQLLYQKKGKREEDNFMKGITFINPKRLWC